MTVTNPYYEFDPPFVPGTTVRSDAANAQFNAIQSAFDILPGAADATTTDTATFAPESGTGNAYVVTMPDTRTANNDGDAVRFFATHTNTGAATLAVDAIPAVAIVDWDGSALSGNEIVSGRIYELRYDATNSRFVISSATDGALQVTYAQEWATRAEDDPIPVSAGGDGSTDFSALHWAAKSAASAIAGIVNTDINTATPPTTEAVTGAHEIWDADTTDLLATAGYVGSNTLQYRNFMHGGNISFIAENAAGTVVNLFAGDPDSSTTFFHTGLVRFNTLINGAGIRGNLGNVPNVGGIQDTRVFLLNSGGTTAASIGFATSANLAIRNQVHGGGVFLQGENNAGTLTTLFGADPDATADLYYAGTIRASTGASGTLDLFSDGNTDTELRRLVLRHQDSTVRAIVGHTGAAALNVQNLVHGGLVTLQAEDALGTLRNLFSGDPDGDAIIYRDSFEAIRASIANQVDFKRTDNAEGQNLLRLTFQDGTHRALIGFTGATGELLYRNEVHGGTVTIEAEDALGTVEPILFGDPDGQTLLHYVGDPRASTDTTGFNIRNDTDTRLNFYDQANVTRRAFIRQTATQFNQRSEVVSASLLFEGTNSVSAVVNLILSDPDGNTVLYNAGNDRFYTTSTGSQLRRDDNLDTSVLQHIWAHDDGTTRAFIGFTGDDNFVLRNTVHGANVLIQAENAIGTSRTMIQGNPDGALSLMYPDSAAIVRIQTQPSGAAQLRSDGNLDTEVRQWLFNHQDETIRGRVGHEGGAGLFYVRNEIHGAGVRITGENAVGTANILFDADPDGSSSMYHNGSQRIVALSTGSAAVRSVGNTDGEVRTLRLEHSDGTRRAFIGNDGNDILLFRNEIHGGDVDIRGEDAGGLERLFLLGNPDGGTILRGDTQVDIQVGTAGETALFATLNGETDLYYDNTLRFRVGNTGQVAIRSDGNLDTEVRKILFQHQDATQRGDLGYTSSAVLAIRNQIHGAAVQITAEDGVGTERTILDADPDAVTTLRGDTDVRLECAAGELAYRGVANGASEIYHDATIAIQTVGGLASDRASWAEVRGHDGGYYDIGYNIWPQQTFNTTNATSFDQAYIGQDLFHTDATARVWTTYAAAATDENVIPIGAAWKITNTGTGTLTLAGGTGITLRLMDGSGATGNVVLNQWVTATVYKALESEYHVWKTG